jgi:hypothetical protein
MERRQGNRKRAKASKKCRPHDNYELPKSVNFNKVKFIGFGIESLERYVAERSRLKAAKRHKKSA